MALIYGLYQVILNSFAPPPVTEFEVPNLIGMTVEAAEADPRVKDIFTIVVEDTINNDEYPAGQIIHQDPEPERKKKSDFVITVLVSKGVQSDKMPSIVGLERTSAEIILKNLRLDLQVVIGEEVFSDEYPAGQVIKSVPAKDEIISKGDTVTLTISKGKDLKPVTVISFLTMTREKAEQEVFSLDELARAFDLAGMSKSPAIFDIEKLTHFNALYLRAMSPEAFARAAEPYIRQAVKDLPVEEIAALLQARCEKLTDIPEKVAFFQALPEYGVDLFTNKKSKTNPEVSRAMLEAAIPMLEGLSGWTQEAIHDGLTALAEKLEVKNATLMWPVRIAAAGQAVTPGGAVEICLILGREECLRRLRIGLEMLGA